MEFSLDSLDGFPVDSDILEASEGHVTDSPTTKILSPKPCVKSRDQKNTVVSNQGYHNYGTSTKTKESEGRIDTKSQTLFDGSKKLPEAKISLGNTHKYQTSSQITNMRSPSSTPKTTDFATTSQQYLDHRQSALKLDSNCATQLLKQTARRLWLIWTCPPEGTILWAGSLTTVTFHPGRGG